MRDASESDDGREDGDMEQPALGPAGANQGEAGPSGLCARRRGQTAEAGNGRHQGIGGTGIEMLENQCTARPCPWRQGPLP